MAILRSGAFNNFKGRVGNVVGREENGQTIIYAYQPNIKISTSKASIDNRKYFGICSTVASQLQKIQVVKDIWKGSNVRGKTEVNKINSINRSRFNLDDLPSFVLVPAESYFAVNLQNYTIEDHALKIVTSPLPFKKYIGRWRISAQGLLYLTNPKDPTDLIRFFSPMASSIQDISDGEPFTFTLPLPEEFFLQFDSGQFIIDLILYDQVGKAQEASVNLSGLLGVI